jgi:hypothetical protein
MKDSLLKLKNRITFIFIVLNLFFPFNGFALEVGDKLEVLYKFVKRGESMVGMEKRIFEILDYDKKTDSFQLEQKTIDYIGNSRTYEWWVANGRLPNKEEIENLLRNCEELGWKKEQLEIMNSTSGKKEYREVCVTNKKLYVSPSFLFKDRLEVDHIFKYYYGHFPILGLGKITLESKYWQEKTVWFIKNL